MTRTKAVWLMAAVALTLATASATTEGGFRRYYRLTQDVKSVKASNQALSQENGRLRREVESLRTDARAVERAAREELGFVRPGELVLNLEAP